MPKIVLFGSNGFVGHNIKDYFLKSTAYSLLAPSSSECNLLKLSEVQAYLELNDPDFIINAAFIGVDSKREYSDDYVIHNMLLQTNVMTASRSLTNLKKLFVFGSGLECSDEQNPITEESKISPKNTYATIKAINTLLYQDFSRQYGIPLVIFRLFNLYGPYDTKSVVYYIVSSILSGNDFKITKGDQVRDYLYCGDLPIILESGIKQYKHLENGNIYNVASGNGIKLRDIFEMVYKITDYKETINPIESPTNEYWKHIADVNKITKAILYPQTTPLKLGIERTVAWVKQSL